MLSISTEDILYTSFSTNLVKKSEVVINIIAFSKKSADTFPTSR